MSSINFPAHLTAQEIRLKEMFEKLKAVQRLENAPKSHLGLKEEHLKAENRTTVKRSIEEAEQATEEVKKKVMSGVMRIAKTTEKSTFKRLKVLEKKPTSSGINASSQSISTNSTVNGKIMSSNLYGNFVVGGSLKDGDDSHNELNPTPVNKGTTLYIRGYDLMEERLKKAFEKYGKIARIRVEDRQRTAFVIFEDCDHAEKALEMDGNMVVGITVRVSYARKQNLLSNSYKKMPLIEPKIQRASCTSDSALEKQEIGRNVITYDDDDTFA